MFRCETLKVQNELGTNITHVVIYLVVNVYHLSIWKHVHYCFCLPLNLLIFEEIFSVILGIHQSRIGKLSIFCWERCCYPVSVI
jgi:hypothetical protein